MQNHDTRIRLSEKALQELREIVRKEFGTVPSDRKFSEMGIRLLELSQKMIPRT